MRRYESDGVAVKPPGPYGADELWASDRYVAFVRRDDDGYVCSLSIKRVDRAPANDWRHLQQIKDEIAGKDCEAINLHPAFDRVIDSANQTWLWVFPPGVRLPVGFNEGRKVLDWDDPAVIAAGARQRRIDPAMMMLPEVHVGR